MRVLSLGLHLETQYTDTPLVYVYADTINGVYGGPTKVPPPCESDDGGQYTAVIKQLLVAEEAKHEYWGPRTRSGMLEI